MEGVTRDGGRIGRGLMFGLLAGVVLFGGSGCGNLTVRTWVKVIEAQSSGSVTIDFGGPQVLPISRLQGGFLGRVVLDTSNLFAPLPGTITLEDVRIAGDEPSVVGNVCAWGNPAAPSTGTVVIALLGGQSSVSLTLNLLATTTLSETFELPPAELSQAASFPLGSGVSLTSFLDAQSSGSPDGLFATQASFTGASDIGGIPIEFKLNLRVNNDGKPPAFSTDLATFCQPFFDQQGSELFYSINSKSSYLLSSEGDNPAAPLVIDLADLGAGPGDTVRLTRVGTFADETQLTDGSLTSVTGLFSSTNVVLGNDEEDRVPGAIDAGTNIVTGSVTRCFLLFCFPVSTDIPEDFVINPGVTLVVPPGAAYLIAAPRSPELEWEDDSGFGLGVTVEVNP